MLIRRVLLTASGLVLTAGLLSAQTVADAARQNRAEKKAKRVYTSEDMAPAKPEPPAPAVAAETKPGTATSKKKKKEQTDAAAAASAAAAAAAEALVQERAKYDEIITQLTDAETSVSEARQRAVEIATDPNATEADKSSAKDAVEAADARRKELRDAALAQRKKAGAEPKLDETPATPPPTETPQ